MSTLVTKIENELRQAQLNKDTVRTLTLRSITSALTNEQKKGSNIELTDKLVMDVLVKQQKQRKDSIKLFTDGNRPDLVEKETNELNIIQEFLPQMLTVNELELELQKYISNQTSFDPTSKADTGKAMGYMKQNFNGRYEQTELIKLINSL